MSSNIKGKHRLPQSDEFSEPYSRANDLIGALVSLAIGLLAAYWPYHLDHRFYFNDDEQTQIYPYYLEIGQQLRQGQWPFLTLTTLNGGNLINDWQYALFNPVSLLSYWLIAPVEDLCSVGLMLASFYLSMLALGGYVLARSFRVSLTLSVLGATVLCTNNFVSFIYGHSWMPCLVASSWFLWAWSFIQFYRSTGKVGHLVAAIFFSYLTLSAGWPQTIIMLGTLVVSYIIEMILDARCPQFRSVTLAIGMLSALMLVSPAFLPAILSRDWTCRGMSFSSHGLFMANLGDFLNLSAFDLMPRMSVFGSNLCAVPLMHLAWFIVPLLPLFRWSSVVETLSHQWALGLCGAVGLLLLFGPQSIGPIRWPIRFLPLPHTVILLSFLLIINKSDVFVITLRRCLACTAIVFLSLTSSISTSPDMLELRVFSACVLGFLTWIAVELIRANASRLLALWLILGVLVGYAGSHCIFKNPFLPDFGSNSQVLLTTPSSKKIFDGYILCLSGDFKPSQTGWSNEAFLGAQTVFSGERSINGYTSVGHRTFSKNFHCGVRTDITSPEGIANLFSIDATTGLPFIDLLRVNTLIIEKETALPIARPLLGNDWKEVSSGLYAARYERTNPNLNLTTLAWTTPGTSSTPLNKPCGEGESLRVAATPGGSSFVFARLWWPGYAACLNGTPVATKPVNDLLVGVQLPPHAQGILSLTFTPPGYRLGQMIALGGLLIVGALVFLSIGNGFSSNRRGVSGLAGTHDIR